MLCSVMIVKRQLYAADCLYRRGGVRILFFWVPVTYTVCLFRPIYHSNKKKFQKKCHIKIPKNKKRQMVLYFRNMKRSRSPYWNFWKVVFAGWIIRYPKTMSRVILLPLGFLIVLIYNAVVN